MLIVSELFLTVYFNHCELENGIMTTPKRRSILQLNLLYNFNMLLQHFAECNLIIVINQNV